MTTIEIIAVIEFVVEHGAPAARDILAAIGKDDITQSDWDEQVDAWKKSPDQFLAEAKERAGK